VPAWAEFMKQATAKDAPDWFQPPADVEKVTICRLSGLRATDACKHGWMGPDFVQAGLTQMPGSPAGDVAVGTSGRPEVAPVTPPVQRSTVYDDYFPIGSAPTESCQMHGEPGLLGISGSTDATPAAVGTSGVVAASYPSGPGTHLEKITMPDGRQVWVVKQ
jgi:hypothetical protein